MRKNSRVTRTPGISREHQRNRIRLQFAATDSTSTEIEGLRLFAPRGQSSGQNVDQLLWPFEFFSRFSKCRDRAAPGAPP